MTVLGPLSVFDELMLAQDSPPSYPGTIVVRAVVGGRLDLQQLESAAQQVAHQHPVLFSKIEIHRGRKYWKLRETLSPILLDSVAWSELFERGLPIDLYAPSGVNWKIFLRHHEADTELFLIFHHACVDGKAASEATFQLLNRYREINSLPLTSSTAPSPMTEVELDTIRRCFNKPRLNWSGILRLIPKQLVGLLGVRQFLMRQPIPLRDHQPFYETSSPPMQLQVLSTTVDSSWLPPMREIAKERRGTINDFLTTLVFRVVQSILDQDDKSSEAWIRLMVPIDMRRVGEHPMRNVVSSVFLDRQPNQLKDWGALFDSIRDEMGLIKRNELGYMLLFSLWVRRLMPGGIASEGKPKRCPTSLVFTNVGKIPSDGKEGIGNLKEIAFVPPLGPFVVGAFSASTLDNRVTLTLRTDPRVVPLEMAENWFRLLLQELANTIDHWESRVTRDTKLEQGSIPRSLPVDGEIVHWS